MNIDILQNFQTKDYTSYPFPHFEINKMFDEKVYDALNSDYKFLVNKFKQMPLYKNNNIRMQLSANEIKMQDFYKKSIWFDFINYHTSKVFFNKLIDIFIDDIIKIYPKEEYILKNLRDDKNQIGVRENEKFKNKEFNYVIDCQPGINTPVISESSVRGPHVDNPVELIGGLAYFRQKNDLSKGGDLKIYKINKKKIYFRGKAEVENTENLELYKLIKYRRNHCIFFLNSMNSIHSITPRSKTEMPRYLINFVVEKYRGNKFFNLRRGNFLSRFFKKIYS